MEKNINDKTLNNAAMLFILTIVLVIIGQWWMAPSYALPAEKVLDKVSNPQTLVLPDELASLSADSYTALLIGSNGASLPFSQKINLPFSQLLSKEALKTIPADKPVVIFGDTETQAMMALQLLSAQGFKNVRAAANDIRFTAGYLTKGLDPQFAYRKAEKAAFNYEHFFKTNKSKAPAAGPAATQVVKTQGGCS